MAKSRLHELSEQGVSVWIDSLSREMMDSGELERLIDEDDVVGVTTNPSIFQKALASGDSYDDPGSGGPENAWTTRNTVFMTWNLLHLARMLRDAGGIPAHGNSTHDWDLSRPAHPNPEYR